MKSLLFKLTRPAKKRGGDRYEHYLRGNPNDNFVIYIPQSISRTDGMPFPEMEVTFDIPGGGQDEE